MPLTATASLHGMLVAFLVRSQGEHFLANLGTSFRFVILTGLLIGLANACRARRGDPPSVEA